MKFRNRAVKAFKPFCDWENVRESEILACRAAANGCTRFSRNIYALEILNLSFSHSAHISTKSETPTPQSFDILHSMSIPYYFRFQHGADLCAASSHVLHEETKHTSGRQSTLDGADLNRCTSGGWAVHFRILLLPFAESNDKPPFECSVQSPS